MVTKPPRLRETTRRRQLGRAGEDAVIAFLRDAGLTVLTRNYHTPYGELDVVAADGECLVFAEVKTARAESPLPAQGAFTKRKAGRVYRAALYYLQKERPGRDEAFRFDLLAVTRARDGFKIEHYPNIPLDGFLSSANDE